MSSSVKSRTRNKILAIASAGLVLGVGGTVSLAAWIDTEWVYGGVGGDTPGVGTSTFIVEQNPTSPFSSAGWLEEPENTGSSLVFTGTPLALTPGDVTYARVALRTTADSVAGTVAPQPAVAADGVTVVDAGNQLWDALELRVGVIDASPAVAAPNCSELNFATYTQIADGVGLDAAITGGQALTAASGNVLYYCFEITLPDDAPSTLMGRTVAPAWEFVSTSS